MYTWTNNVIKPINYCFSLLQNIYMENNIS